MNKIPETCPKCRGKVIDEGEDPHCINCGWVYYKTLVTLNRAGPGPAMGAAVQAEPAVEAEAPGNSANDQPGAPDPDNQATQTADTRPPRCASCKHLAEYGNRYFCESRICPGRLPISIRPEFRKKRQPAGPDDKPWTFWGRAKKIEVGREAQRSGCYAAAEKFGVPMLTARSYLNTFIRLGDLPPDPMAGKSTERRRANAAARAGRAMPAERSPTSRGDPLALLPLPAWRDEWQAPVQVAWLRTLRYLLGERNNTGGKD